MLYLRAAEIFRDLLAASSEGSRVPVIRYLNRPHLLVIDEWGAAPCLAFPAEGLRPCLTTA